MWEGIIKTPGFCHFSLAPGRVRGSVTRCSFQKSLRNVEKFKTYFKGLGKTDRMEQFSASRLYCFVVKKVLYHQLHVFCEECAAKESALTCSPDSLEAAWDGFLVSNNHKSRCFQPLGMESGPAWRSPTWWLQTTTERGRGKEGEGERERERERVTQFWIPLDFTHFAALYSNINLHWSNISYGNNTAMFVETFWTSCFKHNLQECSSF